MVRRLPDGFPRWVGEVGPATANRSPVFANYECAKHGAIHMAGADVETLWDNFRLSCAKNGPRNYLGQRADGSSPYTWLTYSEVFAMVEALGSALAAAGVKKGDKVGIFGSNAPEWLMAMQACNRMGLVCVPVYESLGPNAAEYILSHSEAKAVFVSSKKLGALAAALPKTGVTTVVYWGSASAEEIAKVPSTLKTASCDQFIEQGKASMTPATPPSADDLSTIMYTSGTTGDPKGVMLTHRSLVHTVYSLICHSRQCADLVFTQDDVLISYLPLAHIFERVNEELFTHVGGSIGYWRGDIAGLMDDLAALRPTMLLGVPRVFDRIYARVQQGLQQSLLRRLLFNWLFSRKKAFMMDGAPVESASWLADTIVFSKIKGLLGGRVRVIVSGGAPIARHTEEFVRVAMCAKFVQGYGLTETCAASFVDAEVWDGFFQTAGFPTAGTEFCLESLPEMGYNATADPPRGEILLRGPGVFAGYFKDQAKTAETFSGEWFRTGDVGEVQENGALKIIDRAKNMFKLAQGEYVSSEVVEAALKKNTNMDQIFVYGESTETYVVAVVVPSEGAIKKWAASNGIEGDFAALCAHPAANKWVMEELEATGREAKLRGFEMIKKVHVTPEAFTVENDLMTPTFKLRRPQLKKRYLKELNAMYGK